VLPVAEAAPAIIATNSTANASFLEDAIVIAQPTQIHYDSNRRQTAAGLDGRLPVKEAPVLLLYWYCS
jgi:hypothetical protein